MFYQVKRILSVLNVLLMLQLLMSVPSEETKSYKREHVFPIPDSANCIERIKCHIPN